ncbi:glycosyltransferase family 39 protein [Actinoplanes sp. TFC3]|uniref:glycosyltransferase family 39 protein n=1 Tax=Actinoplanes sp. TFC3 TaxID=1710355 RepID=UPI000AC62A29|nr:glycosyltransferase family 39 protein [Actinoplanes sp. TFC3]
MAPDTATSASATSDVAGGEEAPASAGRRLRESVPLRIALPPFVVTLIVMLIGLGDRQLWRDENATWWASTLSFGDLRKLVETVDVVLLPYYVLMHGWIAIFGDSETALRLPSALFMALAAAVIALIGRRLSDPATGLVAGLLVPVVPVISRYGQEARPYAMAMLASVTAVWLLLRAIERPTVWRWLGYAVAVAWIGCSHVVALMALAAHFVLVLWAYLTTKKRALAGWPAAVLLAVLAISPLVLRGQSQGKQISWIPDATWERVQQFPGEVFMSFAVAGFFLVVGLGALAVTAFEKRAWTAGFLAVWTLLPPLIAYVTFDEFHFFYPRYLLFTVPAWILLGGFALRRLAGSETVTTLAAVTVVAAAGLAFAGWDQQAKVRSNAVESEYSFRAAAAFIRERQQPGDGIIFTGYPYLHRGFRYEWRDEPAPQQPREILVDQPAGQAYSWVHPACRDTRACLGATERIWLVSSDPSGKPLDPLPANQQKVVTDLYVVAQRTVFHRLWVSELIKK